MDRERIGKLIQEKRKSMRMTQQELADILYITDKSISKWERGVSIPDISLFPKISEVLSISLQQLLFGEVANTKDFEEKLIEKLKKEKRKRKNERTIFVLVCWFFLFLIGYFIFLNYKNPKAMSFVFDGVSQSFELHDGLLLDSNQGNYFTLGSLNFRNASNIEKNKISSLTVSVFFENEFWASNSYIKEEHGDIEEWFKSFKFRECKYPIIYANDNESYETDALRKINKNNFPHNMKVTMSYCLEEICEEETLTVSSHVLVRS